MTKTADSRRLRIALGVSVLAHALLLLVRFVAPDAFNFSKVDSRMEVVLVNAATSGAPLKPDVLAQVNSEGGGPNEKGRASSPLVASDRPQDGDAIVASTRRVRDLEEEQRRLVAMLASSRDSVSAGDKVEPKPVIKKPGVEEDREQQMMQRLQAQIEKQIEDYNKRPRRMTFGVNAQGVSYARYVEQWRAKIEKLGTQFYPDEARGRIYGQLVATVEIARDGSVLSFRVDQPSGQPMLDRAAERIVRLGEPYPPFPPEMSKESDILQITRTYSFTNQSLKASAVQGGLGTMGAE